MRSTDSCFSVWAAMCNNDWSKEQFERVPTPKDYFDRQSLTDQQLEIFRRNVIQLREFTHP